MSQAVKTQSKYNVSIILLLTCLENLFDDESHLGPVADATSSLLPVSTGELVPNLGRLHSAHSDLTELVALLVEGHHHLVNDARLRPPHAQTRISLREPLRLTLQLSTRFTD